MPNLSTHFEGWMVVYVAHSEPEAYVVVGRLKANGIQAWVHQEPIGSAYGFSVGPLAEVNVLVLPEDYDRALAVLDEDIDIEDDFDDEDDEAYLDDGYNDDDDQ